MKRILLDQGLAPSVAAILREHGWDAVHVSEAGLQRAEDTEILAGGPSVVFLRIHGLDASGQAALIRSIWEACENVLAEGVAISADTRSVRIRRLRLK